jgi:hypothetical protein
MDFFTGAYCCSHQPLSAPRPLPSSRSWRTGPGRSPLRRFKVTAMCQPTGPAANIRNNSQTACALLRICFNPTRRSPVEQNEGEHIAGL